MFRFVLHISIHINFMFRNSYCLFVAAPGDDIKHKIYDLWTKSAIPFNAYTEGIVTDFTTPTSLDETIMVTIDFTKINRIICLLMILNVICSADGNWECDQCTESAKNSHIIDYGSG